MNIYVAIFEVHADWWSAHLNEKSYDDHVYTWIPTRTIIDVKVVIITRNYYHCHSYAVCIKFVRRDCTVVEVYYEK